MSTTTLTALTACPVPAPARTHGPPTPDSLLALREGGRSWSDVARAAGVSRQRVVAILASTGYWTDQYLARGR